MQGAHRPGLLDSTTVRCADTPIALGCYSIAGPAEVSTIDPGQKRVGPDGQHSGSCVYINIYTGPAGIALLKIKVLYWHQCFYEEP